jgi:hypothetical protein
VGTAKKVPDSRTPRRLTAARAITRTAATTASWPEIAGIAEAAFCTPEETDTATVST